MPEESKDNAPIKSTHLMMTILRFVGPFKGLLVFSIVLNTVFSALNAISIGLVKPVFTIIFNVDAQKSAPSKNFLDQLENNFYAVVESIIKSDSGIQQTLLNLGFLIVFMFVVKNVFKYWSSVTTTRLEESIVKSIRDKVFSNMTSLSVDYFTKSREGTLISIISNDVQVLNSSTIASFSIVLREFTQVVLFLVLLLGISIKLTLIAFSTSIISLLLIRFAMKYLRRYASRMQTAMADYTTTMQETIAGIRVVKAYNAESTVNRKFFENTKKYVRSAIKHQKIITLIPSINEVFAILALCVVLLVGAGEVLAGSMKSDELMAFLFFLFAIMSPIATIINSISQFQRGLVAASRVNSILEQKSTVETGIDPIAGFAGEIEFRNVSFAYKDAPVLRNVSFKIPKSSRIAFVGPSGSGKSTALDLLIRFYDPTEGEILIDGRNIREFRTESYRSLFGIVGQESWLFNETIGNNISFGREGDTSEEAVSRASKLANAFNFITRLPDSFKTSIGDRGVMLSGGERQRISIARALLRNPQILVFDEATSSLDAESEKIVQEAINESLKDRTAVLVAHRLATIIDCDMIYVFDQGRIVEFGSHEELMNRQGTYRRLYDLQFSRKDGE